MSDPLPNIPADDITPQPSQEDAIPAAAPKKNWPPKAENPKSEQFTGRATKDEFARITAAITARRKEGQTYDIVRLTLDMLNHIEDDVFQTFTTK